MKHLYSLVVVFVSGCIGDRALPIVTSTTIPETQMKVHLGGPNAQGNFGYYVTSPNGIHSGYRTLGHLKPTQTTPATLEKQSDGVFRIQWGDGFDAQYAIIDVKNKLFVEDSSPSNPKEQPFSER